MEAAHDIYQRHLDEVSKAVYDDDFASIADHWGLPHTFISHSGREVVEDEAILRRYMTQFHRHIRSLRATAFHRICLDAQFRADDPDVIEGRHRSYILRGGSYAIDPYLGDMALECRDGVWRATMSRVQALLRHLNPLRAIPLEPPAPAPPADPDLPKRNLRS